MPAPTTYQPPEPKVHDLLARIEIDREGVYPTVAMIFRSVGPSDGSSAFGLPKYPQDGPVFTLFMDSRLPLALMQIGGLMAGVAARITAGESLDAALANEAYDVLAQAVALNSTAAILDQLGVEVRGANPFPD